MVDIIDKTYRQIVCYNEKIGHLYVPNINARIINEKGGYYVRTNSLGFRSQIEFKKEKTRKPRILFLVTQLLPVMEQAIMRDSQNF